MLNGGCSILRSAELCSSSDSDDEQVVGGVVEIPRTISSQELEDCVFTADEAVIEPNLTIHPPPFTLSQNWQAGDAIPATVLNTVMAGKQSKEIANIRREALEYLAQPQVNSTDVPDIDQVKLQALEDALGHDSDTEEFTLTDKEKENMEDYIKANIVDSQIG